MTDKAARERSRRWLAKNPQQSKKWRDANPVRSRELTREWVERNRKKRQIHVLVGNALRDGKLIRPAICDHCGEAPSPNARGASRIEAHHTDYAKPFEITWLCKPCHKKLHRKDAA